MRQDRRQDGEGERGEEAERTGGEEEEMREGEKMSSGARGKQETVHK